jgi:hypothetical protein
MFVQIVGNYQTTCLLYKEERCVCIPSPRHGARHPSDVLNFMQFFRDIGVDKLS